jgi:hypothetical protein
MEGSLITAVTGLLIAVGSGIAWLVQRRDKARPRIARQAAEVAQASDAVGGALTVVQDSLTAEIARLRADSEADRARWATERAADRDRIACLEQAQEALHHDIETVRSMWSRWYRDLADRWDEHRVRTDPPPPPHN